MNVAVKLFSESGGIVSGFFDHWIMEHDALFRYGLLERFLFLYQSRYEVWDGSPDNVDHTLRMLGLFLTEIISDAIDVKVELLRHLSKISTHFFDNRI
jgi:hypothetical protein